MDLPPSSIHVWRVAVHGDGDRPPDGHDGVLSPDERRRADRFRSRAARDRFVRCRSALRILVHAYVGGTSPGTLVFQNGPFGKPILWDGCARRIHFNVSHTDGLGLIALASCGPLGVDLERVRDLPDRDRLVVRCFTAVEQAQYASLPASSRALAFFQGWTRKEAFIKATGEGLSRSLHDFDVSLLPGAPARLLRVPGPAGSEDAWSLHGFEPVPGYSAAVAAPWPAAALALFDFPRNGSPCAELMTCA